MSEATMQAEVTEPATEKKSRVTLIIGLVIALVVAVGGVATAVVLTSSTFDPQTVAEWAEGSEEGEAFLAAQSEFSRYRAVEGAETTAATRGAAMAADVVVARGLITEMDAAVATLPEGDLKTDLVALTALYTESVDVYEAAIPAFVSFSEIVDNPNSTLPELMAAPELLATFAGQDGYLGELVDSAEAALGL